MRSIISQNIRVRHPDLFFVGETRLWMTFVIFPPKFGLADVPILLLVAALPADFVRQFTLGDYCSLSSGVKVWCTSDDFVNDIVTIIPTELDGLKVDLFQLM